MLTATTTRTRLFASALAPGAGQSFGLGVSDVFTEQPAKPQTPGSEHAPQAGSVEASPSKAGRAPHRLLYRGALSLPDSHITLDGLTFVASQSEHGRGSSGGGMLELLDNPLALALESMRGRPTISLLGEQRLDAVHDKWIDEAGDVSMYIHPAASLTRTYVSNILLSLPLEDECPIPNGRKRSPYGIRVSLGDPSSSSSAAPGATEILIFARPGRVADIDGQGKGPLQLVVARLSDTPPVLRTPDLQESGSSGTSRRAPRPDDPTPRKPPLTYFGAKRANTSSGASGLSSGDEGGDAPAPGRHPNKRRKTTGDVGAGTKEKPSVKGKGKAVDGASVQEEDIHRRALEVMTGARLSRTNSMTVSGSAARKGSSNAGAKLSRKSSGLEEGAFKIPAVPLRRTSSLSSRDADLADGGTPTDEAGASVDDAVETANKLFLKRAVVRLLASRNVHKHLHPEFNDLFAHIYRGALFALRTAMKSHVMEGAQVTTGVEKLIRTHMDMYILEEEDSLTDEI